MKALSIRAPWWWAILHGKPVENRDWYTNFRGEFALHASKRWNENEIREDWDDMNYMAQQDGITIPPPFALDGSSIRKWGGCIVGTAKIIDCVTAHPSAFFVGKFGFVLDDPVMLEKPIPFKGALGFFNVPDNVLSDIEDEHHSPFPTGVEA
jgi:hypothetical protein